ncbi:radical SAM protein [Bacteroides sp.]|uniref:radical SAM protein n=1 Tax=Bacteroides sp. TaxID=29523 RepID=UPI003AB5FB06
MENYLISSKDLKIFYSEAKKYFCHIPSGLIFRIDNEDIDLFLDICLNNKQPTSQELKTCNAVYDILNDTIAEYNEPPADDDNEAFRPSCVVLNVSGKCNLLCPYCFARDDDKRFAFKSMDVATSLQAIDYMMTINPNSNEYTVAFFGGEPFLETETIEQIVKITLKKYPKKVIHFTATTNGTILNNKILSLLKDYNFSLMISLDGPQEITNKLRPHVNPQKETFSTIMKNVSILREESISVDFRATLVAGDSNLLSIANFFENQKIPYHLAFCFGTQNKENNYSAWFKENITKLSHDFDELFNFYYNLMQAKRFIWGFYFLETIRSIALRIRSNYSCGAGINMFAATDKGNIFSCMNYTPIANTKIGDIYTGIDPRLNSLYKAKSVQSTVECNSCNARFFCSGGCMAERYAVNKTTNSPATLHCILEQLLFDKYLSSYQYIKNNMPDIMNGIIEHKQLYEN